jgi:hypothetical protein
VAFLEGGAFIADSKYVLTDVHCVIACAPEYTLLDPTGTKTFKRRVFLEEALLEVAF